MDKSPPVTKDFSKSDSYLKTFVQPYVADRKPDAAYDPTFKPQYDHQEYRWRYVNREQLLQKKKGKFCPRPAKECFLQDKKNKSFSSTASAYDMKFTPSASQKLSNAEYASFKLKEDTLYVPPASTYQSPHPLSDVRQKFYDDPSIDFRVLNSLRKLGGAVIPTSTSLTDMPIACGQKAKEFTSVKQLHKCRNKHTRSLSAPFDKFDGNITLGSHGVGWAQDNPRIPVRYRGPDHGISDSNVTQYYHNMKSTNMEAILRYEG